jgi:hypothetical protein
VSDLDLDEEDDGAEAKPKAPDAPKSPNAPKAKEKPRTNGSRNGAQQPPLKGLE